MNWDRAKTILIAAFLALDIFLGYIAFGTAHEHSELTAVEITRAIEKAKAEGLVVATEIPRGVLAAPFLSLKPRSEDPKAIARRLLGTDSPVEVQASKELTVWEHKGRRVTVLETGTILYTSEPDRSGKDQMLDLRRARSIAERFLTERGLLYSDARFDFVRQVSANSFVVQYHQEFQGKPLFGAYITAIVDGGGIDRLRILWFNPIGLGSKKRVVIPATDCLIRIAPAVVKKLGEQATLESIRIGYLSEGFNARQWDAFPVWRFGFRGGYFVYVNGYTGEIEKMEEVN